MNEQTTEKAKRDYSRWIIILLLAVIACGICGLCMFGTAVGQAFIDGFIDGFLREMGN